MHIRRGNSDIFWIRILPKAISFGSNKTETVFVIFLTPNIVELIFLGLPEAILTTISIVSGYFMFMDRFLSIKLADVFGLQ